MSINAPAEAGNSQHPRGGVLLRIHSGQSLRDRDRGFSLIEVMVAMLLFGILGTIVLSTVLATNSSVKGSTEQTQLNEEARLVLNRMARELRQSETILATDGVGGRDAVSFEVDFNNNGVIENNTQDPETLTYRFIPGPVTDPANGEILLGYLDNSSGAPVYTELPILAGQVSSFQFNYTSNNFQYDTNSDGITTWQELDANTAFSTSPDGMPNGNELTEIDGIIIEFTVLTGKRKQQYRTHVFLRNQD